jgi:hypothetical protein
MVNDRLMFADAPRSVGANPFSLGGGLGGVGGGFGGGLGGSTGGGSGGGGGSMNVSDGGSGKIIPRGIAPQVGGFGLADAESDFGGARISFDDLIDTITASIEPAEWEEVGGPGSIEPLGNALVVRATPNIHKQIDAWWLWMPETQADELLQAARPKGEHAKVFGAIDNATFAGKLADIAKDETASPGYRSKITCYNGQTVFTVSGGQQLYVTDVVPVVSNDAVAYQPVVSLVQQGAALQVRPHVTRKGKYAAIDVHTRVNLLTPREPAADAKPKDEAVAPDAKKDGEIPAIDRPQLRNARLATSLRVPVDQTMLVGAMSFDSDPLPGSQNLYLFVKLSVQELRDDLPEEAAGEGIDQK